MNLHYVVVLDELLRPSYHNSSEVMHIFNEAGKNPHKIKTVKTSVLLIKILSFDQCLHNTGDGSGNLKKKKKKM